MFITFARRSLIMLTLLAGVTGCGGRTYYSDVAEPEPLPVSAPEPTPFSPAAGGYRVKAGDTLYSIAFGAGMDWRDVAANNGIKAPYTIYPGQSLRLGSAAEAEMTRQVEVEPSSSEIALPITPVASAPQTAVATGAQRGVTAPPSEAPAPTNQPARTVPATPQPVVAAVAKTPKIQSATTAPVRPGAWQWPSSGKVIGTFTAGTQPHKGVDFSGKAGDPVTAAKAGTIVYAGSGVRGYGNLLIVKHDATFLSAYAHNSRLLVKEGDVVKGGQQIAEMGNSGTDRVKLHFEIRKQGNPVDPVKVLPRR